MDMSKPTNVLIVIMVVILIVALIIFVFWLLCPARACAEPACADGCTCAPKSSCGWSAAKTCTDEVPACTTKTCGGLSGSSGWSGTYWSSPGDVFSGNIGVKTA